MFLNRPSTLSTLGVHLTSTAQTSLRAPAVMAPEGGKSSGLHALYADGVLAVTIRWVWVVKLSVRSPSVVHGSSEKVEVPFRRRESRGGDLLPQDRHPLGPQAVADHARSLAPDWCAFQDP